MKFALSIDLFVYEQYLCSLQCRLVALTHITENITSFGIGVNPLTLLLSYQLTSGHILIPFFFFRFSFFLSFGCTRVFVAVRGLSLVVESEATL